MQQQKSPESNIYEHAPFRAKCYDQLELLAAACESEVMNLDWLLDLQVYNERAAS